MEGCIGKDEYFASISLAFLFLKFNFLFTTKIIKNVSRETKQENTKDQQDKRLYNRVPNEVFLRMIERISYSTDKKPSELFDEFVGDNQDIFKDKPVEFKEKIKKSFKNIVFNMKPKHYIQDNKSITI